MGYLIRKAFEFDAAHRLFAYEGKCANLHGHRYKVEVEVACAGVDSRSISVDFGYIKDTIGAWLDTNWDHQTILRHGDPLVSALGNMHTSASQAGNDWVRRPFVMEMNPTAEAMARFLYHKFHDEISDGGELNTTLSSITVFETPTSSVRYP